MQVFEFSVWANVHVFSPLGGFHLLWIQLSFQSYVVFLQRKKTDYYVTELDV